MKRKAFNIHVNGREKAFLFNAATFEHIIILAFGYYEENKNHVFTITYSKGPDKNPQGSMILGDKVRVADGMVFNVSVTDKS